MPKFAKPEAQAQKLAKNLYKHKIIKSLGTARNYKTALIKIARWSKDIGINGVQGMSIQDAYKYLDYRSEFAGQKTLDMERQAIQAMFKLNGKLSTKETLTVIKSEKEIIEKSRAYTPAQAHAISEHQTRKYNLSTQIAYAAGLRAHELLTIAKVSERRADSRPALNSKWLGREGSIYTVKGKGGLIRDVLIPNTLATQLEQRRLAQPITVRDREINYLQRYDIGGGHKWSCSFSKASDRTLFFSNGGHGLRHSYAQERMLELKSLGLNRAVALETVSQELGHFRAEITEVYLK
ncbi:site-specific integrase [Pseudoalteromonas sp. SR44-2]|uniref:site-specific integrase n=1 Tax=Pseudoalteromonas sp. SR44-2 TaxID=2760937 RepID=UPI001600A63E|nr:site-specific integrase [Pseudoalteromonas sp. SR44-2]MBB1338757.1 site-specific integrase [Pseudoalteromonas sp. SR44-2]